MTIPTGSNCDSAANLEMAKSVYLANRKRRSLLRIRGAFERIAYAIGGRWKGLGSRTAVLLYIARYLADEKRDYVLAHAESLRVSYQHYDWALNV